MFSRLTQGSVLAYLSLAIMLIVVMLLVNGTEPLVAQVFDGGGLIGGLGQAQGELGGSGVRTDTDFIASIAAIINFALVFAAVFAVVAFITAGFFFILGFGSDTSVQRAKKIMIWSAVGLVVIIFSFAITNLIVDFSTAS